MRLFSLIQYSSFAEDDFTAEIAHHNDTYQTGQSIQLHCMVTGKGSEDAVIEWYHDDTQLTKSGRYVMSSNGLLTIKKAQEKDSGNYTCTVAGADSEPIKLDTHLVVEGRCNYIHGSA